MKLYEAMRAFFPGFSNLKDNGDIFYLNTAIAILATMFVSSMYFFYFIVISFSKGILANSIMILMTLFSFYLLRVYDKRLIAANTLIAGIYLSVIIKTYAFGGINSSSLFWIVMVPLFSVVLFIQKRYIFFWLFLSLVTIFIFFILADFYPFLNVPDTASFDSMIDIIGIFLGIAFFSYYTSYILRNLIKRLHASIIKSEQHASNLKCLTEQLEKDIEERKKVEAELSKTRDYFEAVFEYTGAATMICHKDSGIIQHCNSQFEALSGFLKSDVEEKLSWSYFVHESSLGSSKRDFTRIKPQEMDFWFVRKNNESILCHSRIGYLEKQQLFVLSVINIGHRRKIEEELKGVNSELKVIFDNSQVGIMVLKRGRFFFKGNQRLADIFGYENPEEMQNLNMRTLHCSDYNFYDFGKRFYDTLVAGEQIQVEYQLKKKNGTPIWCSLSGKALDNDIPPDLSKGVLWIVDDITSRKKLEFRLRNLASRDYLTGLYNRRQFINLAQKEFDRCKRKDYIMAFFMIDIDHFKQINDRYGHAIGDEALKLFASICISCMRNIDVFGRVGGEEFAVFLPDTGKEQAVSVAERLRQSVAEASFLNGDEEICFTISIGISVFQVFMTNIDDMMMDADAALYRAKGSGRNKISF